MMRLVILVLEIAGVGVPNLEPGAPNATITTGGDAVWWGIVTVTTVGYGDQYPVTTGGRLVGVFLLIGGVVCFATLSGSWPTPSCARARAATRTRRSRRPRSAAPASADLTEVLARLRQQQAETAALRCGWSNTAATPFADRSRARRPSPRARTATGRGSAAGRASPPDLRRALRPPKPSPKTPLTQATECSQGGRAVSGS